MRSLINKRLTLEMMFIQIKIGKNLIRYQLKII